MSDKIERQRDHFDGIAERYYGARRDANHLFLKKLIWGEVFKNWRWGGTRKIKVLEAMCGFAEGKRIVESGFGVAVDYSGFDYSSVVVEKLKKNQPDLNVLCADVTQFEPTDKYDIIILLGGLHHVPDAAEVVVERLANALRPGGYFISLEPTHGNTVFRIVREYIYKRNTIFDDATERAFTVEELFAMFENARFSMADVIYPGLLSYIFYYNPDAFPLLNIGGRRIVAAMFAFDRLFIRSTIGKALSFATLSVWQKAPCSARKVCATG